MNKGFALPLMLVIIIAFVSVPVLYSFVLFKTNSNDVKGAKTQHSSEPGLNLKITSKGGGWDVYQITCVTQDECKKSLMNGKEWGIVSGGTTEDYEINISPNDNYGDKKFIKIFARSGWGSASRTFNIITSGIPENVKKDYTVQKMTYQGAEYNVLTLPLDLLNTTAQVGFID
jgi:hypothetical protein